MQRSGYPVQASIATALRLVTEFLDSVDVRAALIGGLAIRRWTRARTTKDVDLAVAAQDLQQIRDATDGKGRSGDGIYSLNLDGVHIDFLDPRRFPWTEDAIRTAVPDPVLGLGLVRPEYLVCYKMHPWAGREKDEDDVRLLLAMGDDVYRAAQKLIRQWLPNRTDDLEQFREEALLMAAGTAAAAAAVAVLPQTVQASITLQPGQAWHGCDGAVLDKMLHDGLVKAPPREAKSRGYTKPQHGMTYFTRDLRYALIYAVKAAMVGRELPDTDGFRGDGAVVLVQMPTENALPDEDWVGEIICTGFDAALDAALRVTHPNYTYVTEVDDQTAALYAKLRPFLSLELLAKMRKVDLREYANYARFGKQLIRKLPPYVLKELAALSLHVAHAEGAVPLRAWRFDRRAVCPLLKPDGSNLEEVATEVPVPQRVAASGPADAASYWGRAAAGILYSCQQDGTVLLLRRSRSVEQPGTWGIPGGAVRDRDVDHDDPDAGSDTTFYDSDEPGRQVSVSDAVFRKTAEQETREELGSLPSQQHLIDHLDFKDGSFQYRTFRFDIPLAVKQRWTPSIRLNWENDEAQWFRSDELPQNLHFGVTYLLQHRNPFPATVATRVQAVVQRQRRLGAVSAASSAAAHSLAEALDRPEVFDGATETSEALPMIAREYAAEEDLQDDRGLDAALRLWWEDRKQEVLHRFDPQVTGNYIHAFRAVEVRKVSQLKLTQNVGIFWSTAADTAYAHWGRGEPATVLHALVPLSSVDWVGTAICRADPDTGDDEDELRLREGAPLTILGYQHGEDSPKIFPEPKKATARVQTAGPVEALQRAIHQNEIPQQYRNLKVLGRGNTAIILAKDQDTALVLTRDAMKAEWLCQQWGLGLGRHVEEFQGHRHPDPKARALDIQVIEMPRLEKLSGANATKVRRAVREFEQHQQTARQAGSDEFGTRKRGGSGRTDKKAMLQQLMKIYNTDDRPDDPITQYLDFISNYSDEDINFDIALRNFMQTRDGQIVLLDPAVSRDVLEILFPTNQARW